MPKNLAPVKGERAVAREGYTLNETRDRVAHTYPRIPATPPFVYVFNPFRWGLIDGRVLPLLHQHPLQAGVNGLEQTEDGGWLLGVFTKALEAEGRTMIPQSWGPGGSYVDVVETLPGASAKATAKAHISVFADAFPGDPNIRPRTSEYADWLEGLIDEGKLPAPAPHVLTDLRDDCASRLLRAKSALEKGPTPSREKRVQSLEADLKALDAAVKAAGKSKSKRAPVKKAAATVQIDGEG